MTKQSKSSSKQGSPTQRHPLRPSLEGLEAYEHLSGAKLAQLQNDLNRSWQFMPIQMPRPKKLKEEK